jgi:hypothetical protein
MKQYTGLQRISSRCWSTRYALSLASALTLVSLSAESTQIEDYFPDGVQLEVKRSPLEPEKKAYLQQFGISEEALALYGDLFVGSYRTEDFRWGDLMPDDLGSSAVALSEYRTDGLKQFGPVPDPGVHPRVLFTDADRAAHMQRLTGTTAGREAMKILHGYTAHLKGEYDPAADYAQPDIWKGSFGTHGFLELFRAHQDGWGARSQGIREGRLSPGLCVLEAYRCWLYQDDAGMKKVVTAFETLLRDGLETFNGGGKQLDTSGFNTSYLYDIAYNQMTEAQRALFRSVIIATWYNRDNYGMFQNAENTTSNWSTFGYQFFGRLGIEGDSGYNELAYEGWKRTMDNYFNYGWFKGGACFEAFGKNQLGGDIMYGMAMRGDPIAAHPHVQACLTEFLPHSILPWGGSYIAYDRWGGPKALNPMDIMPLKMLFPDDPKIDWVYRNTVGDDYARMLSNNRVDGWGNTALKTILFASDYMADNHDPAQLFDTESFIDPQRGLMITRSDWGEDALYLHMHTRGFSGGHVFADRSSFLLAGGGRLWVPNGALSYRTRENSVVSVDGGEASQYSPARLANYQRTAMATFSTADLRPTWNYSYLNMFRDGDAMLSVAAAEAAIEAERSNQDRHVNLFKFGLDLSTETFNDMSLEQEDKPQFNTPQFALPHWLKPDAAKTLLRKENDLQFTKAFRSAGMVRGEDPEHSYALIVDDWQAADGKPHTYDWIARMAPDLEIIQYTKYSLNSQNGRPQRPAAGQPVYRDILLGSAIDVEARQMHNGQFVQKLKKGAKVLLVRVLEMNIPEQVYWDSPKIQPVGDGIRLVESGDATANRLMIKAFSQEPKFKILMYVTQTSDANNNLKNEPLTMWSADKKSLTVKVGDQTDVIAFTEGDAQPTTFTITRDEGEGTFNYGE